MVMGPEATVVAKAGSSVLQSIAKRASAATAWPNMHEGLMELHEILREWCEAAEKTRKVVERLTAGRPVTKADYYESNMGGALYMPRSPWFARTNARYVRREINAVMSPPTPLVQRWSSAKRRRARRRTLQSMMRIYCPELLDDFESAVTARSGWVKEHQTRIRMAMRAVNGDSYLASVIGEMTETYEQLDAIRARLNSLIRDRYPMGTSAPD